jgi:hypothetical protein
LFFVPKGSIGTRLGGAPPGTRFGIRIRILAPVRSMFETTTIIAVDFDDFVQVVCKRRFGTARADGAVVVVVVVVVVAFAVVIVSLVAVLSVSVSGFDRKVFGQIGGRGGIVVVIVVIVVVVIAFAALLIVDQIMGNADVGKWFAICSC